MFLSKVVTHLAVATPFLLLPYCRSLHVIEGGHDLQETLILAAHHKIGSCLLSSSSQCFDFDPSFKYELDPHWKGGPLRPHERALHFVRNPISMALSSYLYHRDHGEYWSFEPGSAWKFLGQDEYLQQKYEINRNDRYTDFLRRVDAEDGIRAEIDRLSLGTGELFGDLKHLEIADELCQASSRCMQVCLEDFTVSSSSYDATWLKVMQFMGKPMSWEMQQCLSERDLNRYPKTDSLHVPPDSLPEWKYNELRELVVGVDVKVFNGLLTKMAAGRLNCGASSFLHAQTGSSATDGTGYTGWLIAEEYS